MPRSFLSSLLPNSQHRKSRKRSSSRHQRRSRATHRPTFQILEDREVLAAGLLQGFAFVDSVTNPNNRFDAGELAKEGATIELQRPATGGGWETIQTRTTGANGYYRFDNLDAGAYRLVETAAGYQVQGLELNATASSAAAVNGTVEVTIPAAPVTIARQFPALPGANARFSLEGGPFNVTTSGTDIPINQFQVSINNGPLVYTLCGDLFHASPATFQAVTSNTPYSPPAPYSPVVTDDMNLARIGYLQSRYGTQLVTPPTEAAGMQLAIWELIYDVATNLDDGKFRAWPALNVDVASSVEALAAANRYLKESETAADLIRPLFLNVQTQPGTTTTQSMVTVETFNFANKVKVPEAPRPTGKISGYIYVDADNDGVRDSGEAALGNVTVVLSGASSGTTTTDASGFYKFEGLVPGNYTVTEAQPAGYLDGKDTVGTGVTLGTKANDAFFIELAADQNGVDFNFGEIVPASVSGFVYLDRNDDGSVDFDDQSIVGALITLTGTDDLGPVSRTATTEADGSYSFDDLRPGTYMIQETQPAGFVDGKDTLGTGAGGVVTNDTFSNVSLSQGASGINYNFGERPQAGSSLAAGRTATIGFWHNKNGQNLIKTVNNGGATGQNATQLGNWLADTFPNLYGPTSVNSLAGKTNADVAALFLRLFKVKGMKVEAQVLATALACYVTDSAVAGMTAAAYGFKVTNPGVGYDTLNIGTSGAVCGVANHSMVTVIQILKYVDSQAKNGKMYATQTEPVRQVLLVLTNVVFTAINERGDIV